MPAREAIGEISCPLCGRDAELHQSSERPKLDPDSTNGQGRAAYPKKFYVVCPPVKGFRGCGTILSNGAEAQSQLLDKAHVFGASERKPKSAASPATASVPTSQAAPTLPSEPPAPKAAVVIPRNPFKLWS